MSRPGPGESECAVNWCDKTAKVDGYCEEDHAHLAGDEKDSDWVF